MSPPRNAHRRVPSLVVAAVTAVGLIGCGLWPPAYQVELVGNTWAVTEIEGQSLEASVQPTISFNEGGAATVATRCRTVSVAYDFDTDGEDITFGGLPDAPAECEREALDDDRALFASLSQAYLWSVRSQSEIAIQGENGDVLVVLAR